MDCGLKRYFKWYCYHNPSNIMNNFNLNRGHLDECQINSQSKYQTRTSWGYFGVSGTMMKTINLYSWLRRLCHLILLSQDSMWVETVCSWRQANQDTICYSSKLAFQKRCFVGFKMCQFSSVAQSCPTLWPMDCSMPGLSVHHQLPKFTQLMSIELVMPSNHLIIICHPLLLLPLIFPRIRVFSNESAPKVAKVVAFQLLCQSSPWVFRVDFL